MSLEQSVAARKPVTSSARLAQPLPGLLAVLVFLTWAQSSGGYFPTAWYAGGLFFVAVLLTMLVAWPGGLVSGVRGWIAVALAALAGFVAWSYLSIGWADVRGDAWDGANRAALYLIVFSLFALWRWSPSSGLVLLGVLAAGVCVLGIANLLAAGSADDADAFFISGRFKDPIGYVNGNAALFLLGFWPALFLASRREVSPFVRPFFLAAAGALVQLALLTQSRGAAISFLLVLLGYFAVVPARTRSFVFLLPVAVCVAAAFPELVDVGSRETGLELVSAARSAATLIAVCSSLLLVVGAVLVLADHRLQIGPRLRQTAGRALAVAAAVALVAGIGFAAASLDLRDRAAVAWNELTTTDLATEPSVHDSGNLLGGFETSRSDLWRVALLEFRAHPLAGVGSENFGVDFVRERRTAEETLYPHSFPLSVLVQTGLVGSILMVIFLGSALIAAFRARAAQTGLARGVSSVAVVVFASWLVHGSIDWLWELPALAAPALAFLALAGSTGTELPPRSPRSARFLSLLVAGLSLAVAISFVFPWLAARETKYAAGAWRVDPAAAEVRLDRARRLNPLTDRPDLVAGSIARRRQAWDAMADAYSRALERNPYSWYSRLQLSLARARQGRRDDARRELERARLLNPSEPILELVSEWLRRGEPVEVETVAEIFLERHGQVTGAGRIGG